MRRHTPRPDGRRAAACLITLLFLVLAFALAIAMLARPLPAQTRVSWSQLKKPPYEGLDESLWCQGPSLIVQSDNELIIGREWSPAAPCYVHFNIVPQAAPDPLNVSTATTPATVTVSNDPTIDDDLYVWATPGQGGSVVLTVGVANAATIQACLNCRVQAGQTIPRVFVSGSTPVGMARVRAGKITRPVHSILQTHQIYLMPGTDMTLGLADGGLTFNLAAAPTPQVQQLVSMLDTARNRAVAAEVSMKAAAPAGEARLAALETRMDQKTDELARYYMDLYGKVAPRRADIDNAGRSLQMLVDEARRLSMRDGLNGYDMRREATSAAAYIAGQEANRILSAILSRVPAPRSQKAPCFAGQFATDAKYLYTCVASAPAAAGGLQPGEWVRARRAKW